MNNPSIAWAAAAPAWTLLWARLRQAASSLVPRQAAPTEEAATREAVRQANAVRDLADRYRRSDPGFASDLYAAAERYERSFDRVG